MEGRRGGIVDGVGERESAFLGYILELTKISNGSKLHHRVQPHQSLYP